MGLDLIDPPSSSGGAVDVTDRAGRLLGIVSTAQLPAALVGGRLDVNIGSPATLPVSLAAGVDVTDRAGRLVGVVSSAQLPAALVGGRLDVNLGAPATLPVSAAQLPAALVGGRLDVNIGAPATLPVSLAAGVDVTDRAGRLVGIVDTELPAAALLIDGLNPSVPGIGAYLMGFNNAPAWDRIVARAGNADGLTADARGVLESLAIATHVNAGGSLDRARSGSDNADAIAAIALGIQRVKAELAFLNGAGSWDRAPGDTTAGLRVSLGRVTLVQAASPAAAAGATLTLPAVAGAFHYITHVYIARAATAALAGGALLAVTTTNLNGIAWRTGNQASITVSTADGMILTDAEYTTPLRSQVINTATTIVLPAPGAAVSWVAFCAYYTAP